LARIGMRRTTCAAPFVSSSERGPEPQLRSGGRLARDLVSDRHQSDTWRQSSFVATAFGVTFILGT
jgi:hypothetical protein